MCYAVLPFDSINAGPLLEVTVDDGYGVKVEPVFQNGGIDAPEVLVGDEVALLQGFWPGLRVLTVHPTLYRRSYGKARAGGAVVGA